MLRMLRARLRAMRALNSETKTLQLSAMSQPTFMLIFTAVQGRKHGNGARKARCARFARNCAQCALRIPKLRPSSSQPCPTECSCQFSQLYKAGNTVTVLAKLAARALRAIANDCVRCALRIPKPRPSSSQPCPTEYSCRISQLYKAGNTETVLAKLAVHTSCAIARDARTQSQNQDPPAVGHVPVNVHANFHPHPTILATTFPS